MIPLRSADEPLPADELGRDARAGFSRYVGTFIVGWFYFVEVLCHPVFEPIAAPLIALVGFIATLVAMFFVFAVGEMIGRISVLRDFRRDHWWLPEARVGAAFLLTWMSWWPWFRVQVEDPDFPGHFVESYNGPLSLAGWLLLLFAILNYTNTVRYTPPRRPPQDGPIIPEEAS